MKAILWEQKYDLNLPKGAIVRCEGCNKIVTNAYLIGPETVEEGLELRVKFKPSVKLTGICYHPDNVVMCKKCLTERFSFKERKLGRPFTVKFTSKEFRRRTGEPFYTFERLRVG